MVNKKAKYLFFLGKGGVGKSTVSALTAIALSQKGYNVLLASLDPAHNQSDIFETQFSETPKKMQKNLFIKEVDQNYWLKSYLKDVKNQLTKTYSYLTAFNLEKYFKILKYSPGIEEYSLLLAFQNICKEFSSMDYLIFDMAPTALTMKFFSLPSLSLIWALQLKKLREEIIKKREIITRVKFGSKEIERDKVLNKLKYSISNYTGLKNIFENKEITDINLVINPDKLSFSESFRIYKKLEEIHISVTHLVVDKYVSSESNIEEIKKQIPASSIEFFPLSTSPLIGHSALEHYLKENQSKVDAFIKNLSAANL
jgi:arsenite-transporting ATPase